MNPLEHHLIDQVSHSRNFFWHRARWRRVSRFLPQNGPFTLLDIGAGAGMTGHYVKEFFPEATYHFIEPLPSLEAHLSREFGAAGNRRTSAHYDGVSRVALLDVLEHQENDRAFIEDILKKMDPGALLIITVPAFPFLWSAWDIALGHCRRYTKAGLLALFDGAAVDLIHATYLFPELVPLALWRKFSRGGSKHSNAEFPRLPRAVNEFFFGFSNVAGLFETALPFGTSVMTVVRKS